MNTQTTFLTGKPLPLAVFFSIIVLSQTVLLFYMIGTKQYTLNTGKPILLDTVPIDPRSLFSGDYVRLSYKISNLTLEEIPGDKNFKLGDTIYITLQGPGNNSVETSDAATTVSNPITETNSSSNRFWQPIYISRTPTSKDTPIPSDGTTNPANRVVIRGIATQKYSQTLNPGPTKTILTVWYGIEQYYVPEGEGPALEKAAAQKLLAVKVKVDKFGRPAIAGLIADGQDIYQEKLF